MNKAFALTAENPMLPFSIRVKENSLISLKIENAYQY